MGAGKVEMGSEVMERARESNYIMELKGVRKWFPVRKGLLKRPVGWIHAVDGVDLIVPRGATVGLVGESGCGKSTLARIMVGLMEADQGTITFEGRELSSLKGEELKAYRRRVQIVFQDPYGSLNPRMTIGQMLDEGLRQRGIPEKGERRRMALELLERVGLPASSIFRYPHEFSGGQRQRIGIARALTVEPRLLVCDEPVSALDVSVQAQIVNLLLSLQKQMGLSYVFISHDLHLVRYISHEVAIMYGGKIMEYAPAEGLERRVFHPYSQGLLAAVPVPDPDAKKRALLLRGEVSPSVDPPLGCRFQSRCWLVEDRCREEEIQLYHINGHIVRCWKVAGA